MILLSTLNARYIHCSLGLRYLYANMADLQEQTEIREFMINQRPIDIAEDILNTSPSIVGFGIYIWNVAQTAEVISILKALAGDIKIILGGPEISHETESCPAFNDADYIIRGQGDRAFAELCRKITNHESVTDKIIDAGALQPNQIIFPYRYYTDEDIRQRVIYVEASRGCPFLCEFCLSALDKTAQAFDIDAFLLEMETLYQRGARHFKFVDRTFNLNVKLARKILLFFLAKPTQDLLLHFEMIPDRLPESLKQLIARFPAGVLQLEIGIQTFDPDVQDNISRRQNHEKTLANLNYLRNETQVHIHADLIAGLPGEDLAGFEGNFDLMYALNPQEIQVGILKRLRGTPIIRHTEKHQLIFNPHPPYTILSTNKMDSPTLFRLNRFARYWDMIANSGRFSHSLAIILADNPFNNFMALTDFLFHTTAQTHRIALPRLFRLLFEFADHLEGFKLALGKDFEDTGIKNSFSSVIGDHPQNQKTLPTASLRQRRHIK